VIKVGEKIVYGRDVCTVTERLEAYKDGKTFFLLTPVSDGTLVIRAPESRIKKIGRPLISFAEIETLLSEIPTIKVLDTDDRMLETSYKSLLESNSHQALISIIKTVYLRNQEKLDKGLKRGEKDKVYFRMAEHALYSELSVVLDKTIDETREYVVERVRTLA